MRSVWVKWKLSSLEHWELSINDVQGEISKALGHYSCEARNEGHGGEIYVAWTRHGPYILCSRQFARYPLLDVRFGRELNIGVLARASLDQPPQTHISEESMPDIRKETDGLGVVEVPANKPCVLRYNVRSS
jgi:hypothetical protein